MAKPVPKNVAAALGLVPTVIGGVRRLPGKAVQLPVIAVGSALAGLDAAKREYGDLADRGEKLIARLRGVSVEDAARLTTHLNGSSTANAKQAALSDAINAAEREVAEATVAAVQAPAQQPPVQQTLPVDEDVPGAGHVRVDSAATPEVIEQVEKIAGNVDAPLITDPAELPLPDYDHMTLGSLRGRLRSLDMQQLVQLRDYEKSKADRLPVVTMLDNRIAKLSSGESTPTGNPPDTPSPKASTPVKPPKKVGETAGAKNSPSPPHGKVRLT